MDKELYTIADVNERDGKWFATAYPYFDGIVDEFEVDEKMASRMQVLLKEAGEELDRQRAETSHPFPDEIMISVHMFYDDETGQFIEDSKAVDDFIFSTATDENGLPIF